MSEPLRLFLQKSRAWHWDVPHEGSFTKLKTTLLSTDVLVHYKCDVLTRLAANTSSSGVCGVLLKENNGIWKAVAYANRSLTSVESRYAAIEKRISCYNVGLRVILTIHHWSEFSIQMDYKPLISLF